MSITMTNRIDAYMSATQSSLSGKFQADETVTLDRVKSELFGWQAVETPLLLAGSGPLAYTPVATHKAITRSDSGVVLGIVGTGYKVHGYEEWLGENVSALVDSDDVRIVSAGTLNHGAKAWVQISTPEGITGPGGVAFKPIIGAYTALDGSMASTYKGNTVVVICENTYAAAKSEQGDAFKVRHTKNGQFNVLTAREALGLLYSNADAFSAEIERLLAVSVSDQKFFEIVDTVAPLPSAPKEGQSTRGLTMAETKRDALFDLWRKDERAATWNGTAWGALQALSTYRQQVQNVKGATREERNMLNTMNGTGDKADVLDRELILSVVGA